MQHNIESLEDYLRATLHAPARLEPWSGETTLPGYLTTRYRFLEGTIVNTRILFLRSREEPLPGVAKKHERALRQQWAGPIAFAFDRITPRNRQRMVGEGLSFVVPGSQIYLPALGMNLRETYKTHALRTDRLRPSSQVLLLRVLTGRSPSANTPSAVARELGYTPMAMGQALDQLEAAELVRVQKVGRERLFEAAGEPADLWLRAQPLLASPAKRKRFLAGVSVRRSEALASGLSALAGYSALSEPRVPVVALLSAQAASLLDTPGADELPSGDEADLEIEVWSYSPHLLSDGPAVDRLSLYLSLRDEQDERVRAALGEMMRDVGW